MNIGNKLKGYRVERGLTTAIVAERLGISEPTYRRYETDKSFPDINMLEKIAKVLEKSFLDLLPSECFVQNNNDQIGGVVVNLGTINNLSEKLTEQYELRIKEKDELIKDLKEEITILKKNH